MNSLIPRLQGLQRHLMVKFLSELLPLYIVNEYPKSGGTWVGQLLAHSTGLPFPRNQFRKIEKSIIHGHFAYQKNFENVLCVWRDGRDLTVSWYYHCLFPNQFGNYNHVRTVRKALNFRDYHDIKNNIDSFLQYSFESQKYPRFNWSEFVNMWIDKPVVHTKYEDMRTFPVPEIYRVLQELFHLTIDQNKIENAISEYDFFRQKKITENQVKDKELNFIRNGAMGDWAEVFQNSTRQLFDHYAGKELIKLGYEKNHDWAIQ
ncbi:MAG: sulfotransferase domain-containing protein [Reichenbachiella sp.]